MELTKLEEECYKKLKDRKEIPWAKTTSQETGAFNRLFKKGLARFDRNKVIWTLLEQ